MFFDGFTMPFVDSIAMNQCSHSNGEMNIGRQRAFGSAGFSVGSLLVGALVTLVPMSLNISKYSVQHFLYVVFITCLLVTSPFLIKRGKINLTSSSKEQGSIGGQKPYFVRMHWSS